MVPSLEGHIMQSSEDELVLIIADFMSMLCYNVIKAIDIPCDLLQIKKGLNGARVDDTKGMKSMIIDWIMLKGQTLSSHIPWNVKFGCSFNHEHTGTVLCPAGLDWVNSK